FTQVDAGVRFGIPLTGGRFVPYGLLAYSARALQGPLPGYGSAGGTVSEWGSAVTYGLGFQLLGSPHLGVDLSYVWSTGPYSQLKFSGTNTVSLEGGSTTTSRFSGGVTWHLGAAPFAAPALPPVDDTMIVGDEVRLRIGETQLAGQVLAI